jgi:glycogen operon protein
VTQTIARFAPDPWQPAPRPRRAEPGTPPFATRPGRAHPLGATVTEDGVNFSLFSQNGTAVELLIFDGAEATAPAQVIRLDPDVNRTFHFWHVQLIGAGPGLHYAYRVDGPQAPEEGHRFDREKVVIDPYARGISTALWNRAAACRPGDTTATSLRAVVTDAAAYDWAGDRPPRRPMEETIVYEMHVGGFTKHPSSGVSAPGTFRGVIEKIPYLQELGVTAVELLPVFQFDDSEAREVDGRRLTNYWGYSTIGYFAPHAGYCTRPGEGAHLDEFRDMVKALHAAGIEVILDVVYNHTDEGNHEGPVQSF